MPIENIKFSESIQINCTTTDAFDFTQDYSNRLKWDTFLKKADLINGATEAGKGVKSYCIAKNGIGIESEYITYNRPKATAVKMTNKSFIFRSFLGSWNFKELNVSSTEATFLYSFSLKFPFSLTPRFITNNLRKNVKQRLSDLKKAIEN